MLALWAALIVILPQRLDVDSAWPRQQKAALASLLRRKALALNAAALLFAIGLSALGFALVVALLSA
ncbi:MAG: hypothetical protein L0332_06380 [Chloroflexi bacterium]|nr:hypothetical protein [Chloroflexota bacterium]MCI0646532.1 hypothetical protein [Chloroflexota bacterium]MCI0726334.1 hypothetical protein [Chloroflexota bacterium]